MSPGLIAGPIAKDIYKMKIKGNKGHVQLRPMLCRGPFGEHEFTLLCGAIEKDSRLTKGAIERAQENLRALLDNPQRRRRERIA